MAVLPENFISIFKPIVIWKVTLLTVRQSAVGFMKGRSCTATLLNVAEDVRLELNENSVPFLVLLNHTKAFDADNHKILLNKLRKLFNFSNSAGSLICSYLLNRRQKVHLNGNISDPLNISRGVPQGSILGHPLSCMYINDLLDVLFDCRVHIYTDDVQLYTSILKENIDICSHIINRDLDKIYSWS